MRYSKLFILAAALLLAVILAVTALAESTLGSLWKAGNDFLFHTDNVTVTGDATFTLDGKLFKTAQLEYVQDGYRSYYGLKLLTPKKDGTEREGGWTIIADEKGKIAIMEAYYPGTYRQGYGTAHNTLLRRSVQLDALAELGGLLAGQLDAVMPEGAVTAVESEDATTVHIRLSGDQIPEVAVSALNVAAGYLSDRWFSYTHDRNMEDYDAAFENYLTETEALTGGTVKWTLQEADVEAVLDAQGRLTAAGGTVKAASTFWDGSSRAVAVQFDLTAKDYGASHVKPFDPEEYHVAPQQINYADDTDVEAEMEGLDDAAWEALKKQADEILEKQGYAVSAYAGWGGRIEQNGVSISIDDAQEAFFFAFGMDGSLQTFQHTSAAWLAADESDAAGVPDDTVAAAKDRILSFLADTHAEGAEGLALQNSMSLPDGTQYLSFHSSPSGAHFVVQVEPSVRMEYYYCGMEEE